MVQTSQIILVTGANTGVGYGIVSRLLESCVTHSSSYTIIMACRNESKALKARESLIQQYFPLNPELGKEILHILIIDLSDVSTVLNACQLVQKR